MTHIQYSRYSNKVRILFFLLINMSLLEAQNTSKIDKGLYYRLTAGPGIGSGYPLQEDDLGIGANIEFALQKHNTVYSLGARVLEEFQLFDNSNINNSVSSADITYGRVFKRGSFYSSVSVGVGWVTGVQQGKLLSREGGWFSSFSRYEKIAYHTIGFPISAKVFWVPARFFGLGTELFVNINSKKTFYGINICHQFGKLRPKQNSQQQ